MKKIGFIGLGSQGAPMARRLIDAGHDVTLWARRAETLEPFADTPATLAASIAELGRRVDFVGICVLDDAGVRQVCDELFPAMKAGGHVAIHATVHPQLCKTLASEAAEYGLVLIDAPVSGGGPAAAAGTLTVMMGGDAAAIAVAQPVFEAFGGVMLHLGDVGAGQMAKLVNNALLAANMAVAHHGLAAGTALGLDRAALASLVKASSGRSYGFEIYSALPAPGAFGHGAMLLSKDVGLLGESVGDHHSFRVIDDLSQPFLKLASE